MKKMFIYVFLRIKYGGFRKYKWKDLFHNCRSHHQLEQDTVYLLGDFE